MLPHLLVSIFELKYPGYYIRLAISTKSCQFFTRTFVLQNLYSVLLLREVLNVI